MVEVVERQTSVSAERELGYFLLAAFGISWGLGFGGSLVLGPGAYLVGVFGPAIAAVLVTRRYEGNLGTLRSHLLRWRIPVRWYLVAVALPLALIGVAYTAVSLLGGAWHVDDAIPLLAVPVYFLFLILVAGGPEELGWRGYALPRLQSRWNALTASLVLGVIWSLWHAPLWLMPDLAFEELSFPLYAVQVIAACVVYTWLYNSTGGSVLLAVLLHASANLAVAYLATSTQPQLALTAAWVGVALLLMVRYGPRDLSRRLRVDREDVRSSALASSR